jgi:hypothetical protein
VRQGLHAQPEARAARQALAPGCQRQRAGLTHQARGQRHRVGRAAEVRRPHALALGGHLVGQQAHGLALAQRAQHLPHAGQRGRRGGQSRPVARRRLELAQPALARRPVEHGHRLARAEALGVGLGRDLEGALVRRQEEQPAGAAERGLDQLGAFPVHGVGQGRARGAQPQARCLHRHAAGLRDAGAARRGADAGQGGMLGHAAPVDRRGQPGEPAQQRARGVERPQRAARQPAEHSEHLSIMGRSPS